MRDNLERVTHSPFTCSRLGSITLFKASSTTLFVEVIVSTSAGSIRSYKYSTSKLSACTRELSLFHDFILFNY